MKMFEKAESFLNSIPDKMIISSLEKNLQDRDEKLYYSIKNQFKNQFLFNKCPFLTIQLFMYLYFQVYVLLLVKCYLSYPHKEMG